MIVTRREEQTLPDSGRKHEVEMVKGARAQELELRRVDVDETRARLEIEAKVEAAERERATARAKEAHRRAVELKGTTVRSRKEYSVESHGGRGA